VALPGPLAVCTPGRSRSTAGLARHTDRPGIE